MNTKTTLFLLLLVLGLGSFIWFFERRQDSTREREQRAGKALRIEPDTITRFSLESPDVKLECVRADGEWQMTSPVRARADAGQIQRILWGLRDIARHDVITARERKEWQQSLIDYGLEDPRVRISLGDDRKPINLRVGRDSPLGDQLYVLEEGRDQIIVTDSSLLDLFPKTLADIRDRRVFTGDSYAANRLEIRRPEGFLQLATTESGEWRIQQPLSARADGSAVRGLLQKLFDLRVEEFVVDAISDPAAYGLDAAAARVSVGTGGQPPEQILALGKPLEKKPEQIYARIEGFESVCAVSSDVVSSLSVKADELRDRRLLTVPAHEITSIRLEKAEQGLELAKDSNAVWTVLKPVPWRADPERVQDFIRTWTGVRIEEFMDETETNFLIQLNAQPELRVAFSTGESTPSETIQTNSIPRPAAVIRIGLRPADGVMLSQLEGEPYLYRISSNLLQSVSLDPLFFRDRVLLDIDRDSVRAISISRDGQTQKVTRPGKGPFTPEGEAAAQADQDALEDILEMFSHLRAQQYVERNPSTLIPYGLDQPECVLTLGLSGEKGIEKSILLGGPTEDGVYAMVRGEDVVFVLDKALQTMLTRNLFKPAAAPPK